MSELRHDPIQRRWVIIASERSQRPDDFQRVATPAPDTGPCVFCPGAEARTPPEILAIRPGGGPRNGSGWQVRVVPNKYPALAIEGEHERRGMGVYDRMHGIGAHEVVIETPDHLGDIATLSDDKVLEILNVYQSRVTDLKKDARFKYILLFKNHGAAAGASLAHPHSQIIATPVTPRTLSVELEAAKSHHQIKERCLFCDVIEQEIATTARVVAMNPHFVAFAPYASRFPFEIFLAPLRHRHDFSEVPKAELEALAALLREVLLRLQLLLHAPPYNFVLHDAPNPNTLPRRSHYWDTLEFDFHWHIEILPRLNTVAGFEWGTGFYINTVPPETAARFLREVPIP